MRLRPEVQPQSFEDPQIAQNLSRRRLCEGGLRRFRAQGVAGHRVLFLRVIQHSEVSSSRRDKVRQAPPGQRFADPSSKR